MPKYKLKGTAFIPVKVLAYVDAANPGHAVCLAEARFKTDREWARSVIVRGTEDYSRPFDWLPIVEADPLDGEYPCDLPEADDDEIWPPGKPIGHAKRDIAAGESALIVIEDNGKLTSPDIEFDPDYDFLRLMLTVHRQTGE